jgi:hypothetical protein
VWPKGRLIALQSDDRGEFSTVTFMPPGRKLLINALTQRAGSLLIEVAGRSGGEALPGRSFADCDPIIGDQFRQLVTWKGEPDFGFEAGAAILLRFRLEKASIYCLDFE